MKKRFLLSGGQMRVCLIAVGVLSFCAFAPKEVAAAPSYTMPNCSESIDNDKLKSSLKTALEYGAKAASTSVHGEMDRAMPDKKIKELYCIDKLLDEYFKKIVLNNVLAGNEQTKAEKYVLALKQMECNREDQLKKLCVKIDDTMQKMIFSGAIETCNANAGHVLTDVSTISGMDEGAIKGELESGFKKLSQ